MNNLATRKKFACMLKSERPPMRKENRSENHQAIEL
jgi:hypothetical protein